MVWRLEAMLDHGLEGTALGTLLMPYCSGLGNLIFVGLMLTRQGAPAEVLPPLPLLAHAANCRARVAKARQSGSTRRASRRSARCRRRVARSLSSQPAARLACARSWLASITMTRASAAVMTGAHQATAPFAAAPARTRRSSRSRTATMHGPASGSRSSAILIAPRMASASVVKWPMIRGRASPDIASAELRSGKVRAKGRVGSRVPCGVSSAKPAGNGTNRAGKGRSSMGNISDGTGSLSPRLKRQRPNRRPLPRRGGGDRSEDESDLAQPPQAQLGPCPDDDVIMQRQAEILAAFLDLFGHAEVSFRRCRIA